MDNLYCIKDQIYKNFLSIANKSTQKSINDSKTSIFKPEEVEFTHAKLQIDNRILQENKNDMKDDPSIQRFGAKWLI
jgi:hypothetical protein